MRGPANSYATPGTALRIIWST